MACKNGKKKRGGLLTALFMLALIGTISSPFILQAAELKIWNRAGNDEIISLRGNRMYLKCADPSGSTTKFSVDSSGNLNVSGNIIASGTITPNSGLGTSSIATLAVAGTSKFTGAANFYSTVNVTGATTVNTTFTVGGVSTFSQVANFRGGVASLGTGNFAGAFSANTTMTVGGVSTFSQAVTVNGAGTVAGALLGVTTIRAGTSLVVGTTTACSGLVTATGGATISGAALTVAATAPASVVTLAVSGSQRWVRTELAASSATTSTATVANIQGGWISLGNDQSLTLPTATTATCAGLDIFISAGADVTAWVVIPAGDGGVGASRDTVELTSWETLNLYCDGANYWIRSTSGTVN